MQRGLIVFAFLVTGGLTLVLGRPSHPEATRLGPLVVSEEQAEPFVVADTLRSGETLAGLLARQSLSAPDVAGVLDALREHADLRRLRPGVTVAVHRTPWDSVTQLAVRLDPDREVHLARGSSGWSPDIRRVPVRADTIVVQGVINSTLYHSVLELPDLDLSARERIEQLMWGIYKPFQWAIDFGLELRKGDRYRALYERYVRPDGSVREARVLAVQFVNRGELHEAVWFPAREEYFDADGSSMKRVFLKAPLDFRRISSRFTRRRYHPVLGRYRAHLGTDYAAAPGTRVWSTADGTVTRAGWWGGYGNVIEVRHINGYRTRYAHLKGIARGVRVGARVSQGELIGYVGATGLANGPHLHYELRRDGAAVDPRTVNLPSGRPVASDEMGEFRRIRDRLLGALERGASGQRGWAE